jgi:hypothetical protein
MILGIKFKCKALMELFQKWRGCSGRTQECSSSAQVRAATDQVQRRNRTLVVKLSSEIILEVAEVLKCLRERIRSVPCGKRCADGHDSLGRGDKYESPRRNVILKLPLCFLRKKKRKKNFNKP